MSRREKPHEKGDYSMSSGIHLAQTLFQDVLGKTPSRVESGYGSFLTFDFGHDIEKHIKTRTGVKTQLFGEWHLWVYMCAWRVDKNQKPFFGSNDPKELIQRHIKEFETSALQSVTFLNPSFDTKFTFHNHLDLLLFSSNTVEDEQWLFFTPDGKVFTAGPNHTWTYEAAKQHQSFLIKR